MFLGSSGPKAVEQEMSGQALKHGCACLCLYIHTYTVTKTHRCTNMQREREIPRDISIHANTLVYTDTQLVVANAHACMNTALSEVCGR